MRTPLQAMLWEIWRTTRWEWLIRCGGACAMVLFIFGVSHVRALSEPEYLVINGVAVMMLATVSVASSSWILELDRQSTGFRFRLGFTRPVSTLRLVTVPILFATAAGVVGFTLPAALSRMLVSGTMPVWEPAPYIACAIVCLMAAAWSPTTVPGKIVALLSLVIGGIAWWAVYHARRADPDPFLMAIGKRAYYDVGWTSCVLLLATSVIALVATVVSVERQRHGERRFAAGFATRAQRRLGVRSHASAQPFANRSIAQCWYEFRRFGTTVLWVAALAPVCVWAYVSAGLWLNWNPQGTPLVWLWAVALCPLVYQLIGADGAIGLRQREGSIKLSAFDATRAMRNDDLIACKLCVMAVCSLFGWLWMGLAAVFYATVAGDPAAWAQMGERVSAIAGDVPWYGWVAGASNAVLLSISSSAVLLAFGLWMPLFARWYVAAMVVVYLHLALVLVDLKSRWSLAPLWTAYGYVLAAAVVAGCVFALRTAWRNGSLGRRLFAWSACLWIVYVASTIAVSVRAAPHVAIPNAALVLGAALLLTPLATAALAPLALASHRHG